jgi:hypothetical protein
VGVVEVGEKVAGELGGSRRGRVGGDAEDMHGRAPTSICAVRTVWAWQSALQRFCLDLETAAVEVEHHARIDAGPLRRDPDCGDAPGAGQDRAQVGVGRQLIRAAAAAATPPAAARTSSLAPTGVSGMWEVVFLAILLLGAGAAFAFVNRKHHARHR